ncbi:MAG: hypothetical protein HY403_07685 [Elusimicrobia bacterium]|nr:hypothetical protein [Elusimicrobiota bacterium]
MNRTFRRLIAALLTAVLASAYAPAQQAAVARVTLTSSLGGAAGVPGAAPGLAGGSAAAPASLSPAPSLSPVLGGAGAASEATPIQRVAPTLEAIELAAGPRPGRGGGENQRGGTLFDGSGGRAAAAAPYVVNDEGVRISGRAALYYAEVRRMVELYKGKIDLEESLDVMDDAYSDVLAKVSAVEAVAQGRGLSRENTHLEETLVWVDGLLSDGAKRVAVHTHRVFFHKSKEPKSEIAEGIRRVDGYIKEAEEVFQPGGRADRQMGELDEVELVFDARGRGEIKEHLKKRGDEVSARTSGRISFKFLDDLVPLPSARGEVRAKLNELVRRHNGTGLSKIYEGVIYSRYVGLLLELKTIEHYHKLGYKVLQSGRELFDANGMYVSELDAVVESPAGEVLVVEAKSARVGLPNEEVLRDKVVYKLMAYKKFKAELGAMIGKKFDAVVFAMDVAVDPGAARARISLRDQRKLELIEFLKSKEAALSKEYGFPVRFLFLRSGPR